MKKLLFKSLFILLLIVGCAPTTATFYIGMTEKEFNKEKPDLDKHAIKRSMFGSAAMILVDPEENKDLPYFYIERKGQIGLITWLTFGKINSYFYIFVVKLKSMGTPDIIAPFAFKTRAVKASENVAFPPIVKLIS